MSAPKLYRGFWKEEKMHEKDGKEATLIRARFRSWDLWVMGPPRFRCATLICCYKRLSKSNILFWFFWMPIYIKIWQPIGIEVLILSKYFSEISAAAFFFFFLFSQIFLQFYVGTLKWQFCSLRSLNLGWLVWWLIQARSNLTSNSKHATQPNFNLLSSSWAWIGWIKF